MNNQYLTLINKILTLYLGIQDYEDYVKIL